MKLIYSGLTLVLLLLASNINAQSKSERFGLIFGANFSNISQNFSGRFQDSELDTKSNLTYHVGFKVDNSINKNFSIQPNFLFNRKGYSIDSYEENGSSFLGFDVLYNYIEVSLDFLAILDNGLFLSGAPYFSYGINGKLKYDQPDNVTIPDIKLTGKIGEIQSIPQDEGIYNAPDAGLVLGTGFQKDKLQFKLSYSIGLNNITPKTPDENRDDLKAFNRVLGTSLTFFFN